jgi:hypothetical protein
VRQICDPNDATGRTTGIVKKEVHTLPYVPNPNPNPNPDPSPNPNPDPNPDPNPNPNQVHKFWMDMKSSRFIDPQTRMLSLTLPVRALVRVRVRVWVRVRDTHALLHPAGAREHLAGPKPNPSLCSPSRYRCAPTLSLALGLSLSLSLNLSLALTQP